MREPIRVAEGTAKPYEPFWRLVDAAESQSGEPEMELSGTISEYSWFDDDVTPKMFKSDLYRIGKNGPITIRINSGGGDPVAASMIRAILSTYPGRKTVRIDGMAASAAVAIAMAGDVVQIMDTGYMMIHEAAFMVMFARLDVPTMERLVAELKTINASLRDVYANQTGLPAKEIARMMAETTWMNANEAVKLGFADEVLSGGKPAGSKSLVNMLLNYENVPAGLMAMAQASAEEEQVPDGEKEPEVPTEPGDATDTEDAPEGAQESQADEPVETETPAETDAPEGAPQDRAELAKRHARLEKLTS